MQMKMVLLFAGLLMATAILSGIGASVLPGAVRQRGPSVGDTVNAYSTIQAENFDPDESSGVVVYNGGTVVYVGSIEDGDYTCYDQIDFQDGAVGIKIQVSSSLEAGSTGTIDLVLEYFANPSFGSVLVGPTHDENNWVVVSEFLDNTNLPTGVHTLCLVFRDTQSTQGFVNVDWFTFFQ